MLSLRTVLAAATLLVSSVQADYIIDPTSVPLNLRDKWCSDEKSTCPLICAQTTTGVPIDNSCDPEVLTYGCVCSDGMQPNISEYSLTIPYYTCTQWGIKCVEDCKSDNTCASACRADHPCGAQNPTRVNTTTSDTMSATGTGATPTNSDAIFTGLAGSSPTDSPDGSGAMRVSQSSSTFGLVVLFASLFLGTYLV